jgi:hypothetical protein
MTSGRRLGRPPKGDRGPERVEFRCSEQKKKYIVALAAARGFATVPDFMHWLVDQELKANPPEVLLKVS